MAAAATDLTHHHLFTDAGEAHRRLMQKILNNDLKENSYKSEHSYQANHRVWRKIPAFNFQYPPISELSTSYNRAAQSLLQWLLVLIAAGYLAVLRLEKEGQQ